MSCFVLIPSEPAWSRCCSEQSDFLGDFVEFSFPRLRPVLTGHEMNLPLVRAALAMGGGILHVAVCTLMAEVVAMAFFSWPDAAGCPTSPGPG